VRIIVLGATAFVVAILLTPILTHFLYKYKLGKGIRSAKLAPIFASMHQKKAGTPTMGGLLVWVTTLILTLFFFYMGRYFDSLWGRLNFLSRSEVFLPLGALVASAFVGLADDLVDIFKMGKHGGGLMMRHRFLIYTIIAVIGAYWFYFKLDWTTIHIPFVGNYDIGLWYIPLFIFVIVATAFSVNEIDGLDGLAGGTLLTSFSAFSVIAFVIGKYDLAAFCSVISGALFAFLWFNIHPARFFMGDTGSMSLGVTLGVIAMITNSVVFLPIIGFLFVLESLSVIIQVGSKKLRGKKVFISAPFHHHLEAIGWPEAKIVMRFWVLSGVFAVVGLILFLLDTLYKAGKF